MPLDPSIIMGYQPPKFPTVTDVAQAKQLQYRNALAGIQLQEAQRKIQSQNALRQAMSNPGAVDPATGMPTQQTIGSIMKIDPTAGMSLMKNAASIEAERQRAISSAMEAKFKELGITEKQQDLLHSQALNLQSRYDGYISSGSTPEQASALVTKDKYAWLDDKVSAGIISPKQAQASRTPFDPKSNQAFIQYDPKFVAAQKARNEMGKPMSSIGKLNADYQGGKINQDQYTQAVMNATGGLDPVSIKKTAHLIATYKNAPLSAWAMSRPIGAAIMAAVAEENPEYDAKLWAAGEKATGAFATGPQGNTVRSFSVAINHLETLDDLSQALKNGNTQVINRVGNRVNQEFGLPAPTNFNAVKKLVSDEIVKAIVGSGGGVTDRQEAADAVNAAMSPAQLSGVIDSYKKLMAGQLDGLRRQYEESTRRHDFNKFLSKSAQKEIGTIQAAHGDQTPPPEDGKKGSAPAAAIAYLKAHPELKNAFQAKYGYVPDGM